MTRHNTQTNLYEAAVREWIARRIRTRGHQDITRDHITNVRYEIDSGFHGSDVTPPDEPVPGIKCILSPPNKTPHEHAESVEFITPAELIAECLAIYHELAILAEQETAA